VPVSSSPHLPARFDAWFAGRGWSPRDHQLQLLAHAKAGESALLVAPTGAGKTLAGFLPSLVDLSEARANRRNLHTLYISPLKALATVGDKRPTALPDVPTVRELGFAGMEVNGWNGIFAPAKTPPEIIARLQGAIAAAMATEAVRTRLTGMGAEATGSGPAELQAAVDTQIRNFRPIIEELRINPEG